MKKLFCIFIVSLLIVPCLFASNDSFAYMYNNQSFADVMDAINTKTPYEKLQVIFDNSMDSLGNDIATRLRLKIAYYDYLNTIDAKKYKKQIKAGVESCYKDFELLQKSNTITVLKKALEFLLYGFDYRATGSLTKGTKSIQIIDKLFEEAKDDDGIMLLYGQRKAEAPAIGGGSMDVALSVFNNLLQNIDDKTDAFKYAVYSELSYIYRKSDKTKSEQFRSLAESLYQ